MTEPIIILGSLPDIQSAINVSGGRNGSRVKIDFPESEIAGVARLMLWRGKLLKITIELHEEEDRPGAEETGDSIAHAIVRRSAKRRV